MATPALFFIYEHPELPTCAAFSMWRGGYPFAAVRRFAQMLAASADHPTLADAFHAANAQQPDLCALDPRCWNEDFGQHYEYEYDACADRLLVQRRRERLAVVVAACTGGTHNTYSYSRARPFAVAGQPWEPVFSGTLGDFIREYTPA